MWPHHNQKLNQNRNPPQRLKWRNLNRKQKRQLRSSLHQKDLQIASKLKRFLFIVKFQSEWSELNRELSSSLLAHLQHLFVLGKKDGCQKENIRSG